MNKTDRKRLQWGTGNSDITKFVLQNIPGALTDSNQESDTCPAVQRFWNVTLGFSHWDSEELAHLEECPRCKKHVDRARSVMDGQNKEECDAIRKERAKVQEMTSGRFKSKSDYLFPLNMNDDQATFSSPAEVDDIWDTMEVRRPSADRMELKFEKARDLSFVLANVNLKENNTEEQRQFFIVLHWGESTSIPLEEEIQTNSDVSLTVKVIGAVSTLEDDEVDQVLADSQRSAVDTSDRNVWIEWARHSLFEPSAPSQRVKDALHEIVDSA